MDEIFLCACLLTTPWERMLMCAPLVGHGIELGTCPRCKTTTTRRIPWAAPEWALDWYDEMPSPLTVRLHAHKHRFVEGANALDICAVLDLSPEDLTPAVRACIARSMESIGLVKHRRPDGTGVWICPEKREEELLNDIPF